LYDAGCRDVRPISEMRASGLVEGHFGKGTVKSTLSAVNVRWFAPASTLSLDVVVGDDDAVVVIPKKVAVRYRAEGAKRKDDRRRKTQAASRGRHA
jgi:4-hydroxy-4-methyl-2-oxoglutarate aldolase